MERRGWLISLAERLLNLDDDGSWLCCDWEAFGAGVLLSMLCRILVTRSSLFVQLMLIIVTMEGVVGQHVLLMCVRVMVTIEILDHTGDLRLALLSMMMS